MEQKQQLALHSKLPADVRAAGLPPAIQSLGEKASFRFVEFFISNIRNKNTRAAYARAVWRFFERYPDLALKDITSMHIAAHIELLETEGLSTPTIKQHLAAIRMVFDFLVVGQVMPQNPAHSVRGPKHVVKKGKTPILYVEELKQLFAAIDPSTDAGKRDRAIIGILFYTFARISAVVSLNREDVFVQNKRLWIRLLEKGGKVHEMPCHHTLEEYIHDYLDNSQITELEDPKTPLFTSIAKGRKGG